MTRRLTSAEERVKAAADLLEVVLPLLVRFLWRMHEIRTATELSGRLRSYIREDAER